MFLGHFGLAFAAKKVAPRPALGTLILGAQLADVIWPVLLLLDIEKVKIVPGITPVTPLDFAYFPYTHSLVADIIWAALFAGGYWLWRRDNRGARAIALGARCAVPSSRRADMAGWPGRRRGPLVFVAVDTDCRVRPVRGGRVDLRNGDSRTRSARFGVAVGFRRRSCLALCRRGVRAAAAERESARGYLARRLAARRVGVLDRSASRACCRVLKSRSAGDTRKSTGGGHVYRFVGNLHHSFGRTECPSA